MKSQPRNVVGPQVRRLRCAQNLSQPALAARCQLLGWNVGRDAIAKIEGQVRWVADTELIPLTEALCCGILDLYPEAAKSKLRGPQKP